VYVVFNQKHWYFEDTKSYNAFVRIRREHMRRMTGTVKVAEIDYYQVCLILDVNVIYSSRTFRRSIKKRLPVIGARMKKRHSLLSGEK
jgi:hypothetical protein